jgi:serine/threonine protein kinase
MAVGLKEFIKRLTDATLMSADEVRAFLDRLPPDEQPRTGKELAEQLARHKRLTAFQAQAVYDGKGEGLVLGNYVILERIGQGGMGTVYKAQHREMKRVVAIKVLAPHLTKTAEGLKRFQREVRAAAALNHPNIVTAYDAAQSKGAPYLVMEYVDGADLASVVKSTGPLPVSRAVQYVLQVARALEYAHSKGIIHRDIKPSNLLVDRQDNVKILDLGLARIQDPEGPTSTDSSLIELTRTGMVLGTVDYMPPEQALGAKDIDHRADIYSLGISLYYLLAGRVPYEGSTLLARFLAHREQEIPSLLESVPDVPDMLDRVFRKMVAKEAQDRYASMSEVVADLQACLAESPVSARPPVAEDTDSAWLEVLRAAAGSTTPPESARAAVAEAPPIAKVQQAAAVTIPAAQTETQRGGKGKRGELLIQTLRQSLPVARVRIWMGVAGGTVLILLVTLLFFPRNPEQPEITYGRLPNAASPNESSVSPATPADRAPEAVQPSGVAAETADGQPKGVVPVSQPPLVPDGPPKPAKQPERVERVTPPQASERPSAKEETGPSDRSAAASRRGRRAARAGEFVARQPGGRRPAPVRQRPGCVGFRIAARQRKTTSRRLVV